MKRGFTPYENQVYRHMIWSAHQQPSNVWYTTSSLLAQINHTLKEEQCTYLGLRFSMYAKKNPATFEIQKTSGNNKYRTR